MLPDRSILIRQKLVENAKIQKFKCNILSHFQTIFSSEQVLEMVTRLAFLGSENFGTFEEKFGYFLTLYSKILSSSMGRGAKNTLSSLNSLIANVPSP